MEDRRQRDVYQDRDRLVRLEEKMNHLEHLIQENKIMNHDAINDLKRIIEKFIDAQKEILDLRTAEIKTIEKRVDKLYVIGSMVVLFVPPIVSVLTKHFLTVIGAN